MLASKMATLWVNRSRVLFICSRLSAVILLSVFIYALGGASNTLAPWIKGYFRLFRRAFFIDFRNRFFALICAFMRFVVL